MLWRLVETSEQASVLELVSVLLHFGNVLLKQTISLQELFEGFDHDASGVITLSEFCSLLRLVSGSTFSKQAVRGK